MKDRIAIIGMACRYPDASSPDELWANVVSRRRAFRRLPDERTPLASYYSPDPDAEDRFYASNAAVIDGYEFDRVGFRIAGSTYRSTDLTHWLALDMASRALADAGYPAGAGLPRESTAVIIGNTLTGEFTRANVLRLRWPYVRRAVSSVLSVSEEQLAELEKVYKAPFPAVDADTLAGGLANTIAGRICNYFDLGGGGYTVDGACSSSLLSITHACRALVSGEADVAVAGGVDLSIDPFELVGFAKTGALAATEMRVYDRRSAGFWPGEGCGMLVLARESDARAQGRRVYAYIAGWGVSSDGAGGITRPEVDGQRLALERAYRQAGFAPSTVGYFEGHGTGTAVGDATEIAALSAVRAGVEPAVLGTVKANIGHTKAAAGVAGVIKAAMAVYSQVIPPTTGCVDPHPALGGAPVRVTDVAEEWPTGPMRAGVSSMGFGGINTHIVLEDTGVPRRDFVTPTPSQDAELLLFDADTPASLLDKVKSVAELAGRLSYANLADLSMKLLGELTGGPVRAAVVASTPAESVHRLNRLVSMIEGGARQILEGDLFYGRAMRAPRIVFAFPGQGSAGNGRTLRARFPELAGFFESVPDGDPVETSVAQPRIAATSAATLEVLARLGISAEAAVGHSLGELTALHWAGAMDATTLVRLSTERGRLMSSTSEGEGAMASIAASREEVEKLLRDGPSRVPAGQVVGGQVARAAGARTVGGVGSAGVGAAGIGAVGGSTVEEGKGGAVGHGAGNAGGASKVGGVGGAGGVRDAGGIGSAGGIGRAGDVGGAGDVEAGGVGGVGGVNDVGSVGEAGVGGAGDVRGAGDTGEVGRAGGADGAGDAGNVGGTGAVSGGVGGVGGVGGGADAGGVVIAGFNAPRQTVVAGPADAVAAVIEAAERAGLRATRLPVSHAFHSPQVAPTAARFADYLAGEGLQPLRGQVVSTVTGAVLDADTDLRTLLSAQITAPVRFVDALAQAAFDADLVVEVGPGRVLTGLAKETVLAPVVATDGDVAGILRVAAAGHVLGAAVRYSVLFDGRHVKPLPERFEFLVNPCEVDVPARVEVAPTATGEVQQSLELVRRLAAERAELPIEAVNPDSGLLDELHLSSITVGQVVADAVRAKGLPPGAATLSFATATVREIADALDALAVTDAPASVDGVAPWVRPFSVEYVPAPPPVASREPHGDWQLFAWPDHPIAAQLKDALPGSGVLVCGADPDLALAGAQAALALRKRFVLVHHGEHAGTVAMAKSLFLEAPTVDTLVIDVPATEAAIPWVVAEAGNSGFTEVRYEGGVRTRPVLRPLADSDPAATLDSSDVLLVTGGAKGITAECAFAMAVDSGASVVLLGRSPETEPEVAANLERFRAAGIRCRYSIVDVTDPAAVRAVAEGVTAVLHGAGRNVPRGLAGLDHIELANTLATKVDGLRNVLDAVGTPKLLVTFGSIIGRAGLAGEAHYATANAAVAELTSRFGREHPECRCLTLEWSVWEGVGMGERLGVVDSLRDNGITPIATADGLAILRDVLARETPSTLVVTGRLGGLPTVTVERHDPPLLRFTDRVLVDYPGVELVTEAELSTANDPYLEDHQLDGNLLFPAVLGMEAMAQVARAVTGRDDLPALEGVEFPRPIVVRPGGSTTIRIAALVDKGAVEVAIRSEESGFAVDHFRATCRFPRTEMEVGPATPNLPLLPHVDLYGTTLFQGKRFQRLAGYRHLGAARCLADIESTVDTQWFGRFLPDGLLLGDPGVRDAFMQAIQGSRPDQTLLPIGVDRIIPGRVGVTPTSLDGVERKRERHEVVWDLTVRDDAGVVVERWEGLRLRVVKTSDEPLPAQLLRPYLERRLDELLDAPERPDLATDPGFVAPVLDQVSEAEEDELATQLAQRERLPVAVARVSAAHRCAPGEAISIVDATQPGWVVFEAGGTKIATYVTTPRGEAEALVFAVRGRR
jgi:enediyne polyketide synthase